jgi:glycerol kinase
VWKSKDDFIKLRGSERVFEAEKDARKNYEEDLAGWSRAIDRSKKWYPDVDI